MSSKSPICPNCNSPYITPDGICEVCGEIVVPDEGEEFDWDDSDEEGEQP